MPVLRFRPQAVADLREIRDYVEHDDPTAAGRLLDRLEGAARSLAMTPLMGPRRSELGPVFRSFAVARYVIFYQPVEGGAEIVRVLHSARDVRRHIAIPDGE